MVTRRYLEAVAARLGLDVQGLLAVRSRSSSQLHESTTHARCDCESYDAVPTATPAPAQPASHPEAGGSVTSWKLEPPESQGEDGDMAADQPPSSRSGSFFTSSMFVLAVFFMAVPVACVIGFVLFCRRRRRQQPTHA
ncbi:unnamed protein product [Phytophthora fragariaefolia]|uniref:Unnamed protein product n=1 Tax=Phytophthora fragariaefolia TaxID=1490495 RepID=A0A9W6Y1N3_9STRA|nr:unnamed protein product [Phytophthora fragariaefolia]